mmetsp:Transcript_97761/g.276542  ORF Transcript_97761/g.276542 Transcript_97761/m.276542 type:complete len:220 (-) Transcript_97761:110-769(-)
MPADPSRYSPTAPMTSPSFGMRGSIARERSSAASVVYKASAKSTTSHAPWSAEGVASSHASRRAVQDWIAAPLRWSTNKAARTALGQPSVANACLAPRRALAALGNGALPQPSSMTLRPRKTSAGACAIQDASSKPAHHGTAPVASPTPEAMASFKGALAAIAESRTPGPSVTATMGTSLSDPRIAKGSAATSHVSAARTGEHRAATRPGLNERLQPAK